MLLRRFQRTGSINDRLRPDRELCQHHVNKRSYGNVFFRERLTAAVRTGKQMIARHGSSTHH